MKLSDEDERVDTWEVPFMIKALELAAHEGTIEG